MLVYRDFRNKFDEFLSNEHPKKFKPSFKAKLLSPLKFLLEPEYFD